jgi:hypothetical protein
MNAQLPLLILAGFLTGFAVPHRPIDRFGRILAAIAVVLLISGAFAIKWVAS